MTVDVIQEAIEVQEKHRIGYWYNFAFFCHSLSGNARAFQNLRRRDMARNVELIESIRSSMMQCSDNKRSPEFWREQCRSHLLTTEQYNHFYTGLIAVLAMSAAAIFIPHIPSGTTFIAALTVPVFVTKWNLGRYRLYITQIRELLGDLEDLGIPEEPKKSGHAE